jgi:hypothetical protein
LIEMSAEAAASSSHVRPDSRRRSPRRRATATISSRKIELHTMRCASTSSDPAGSSNGKKPGHNPHQM